MSTEVTPAPFRLRSLGLSVYLPTFLFAVGQGAVVPIVPQFATDLGGSVAAAAMVVGLLGIGTMVFDVPAGVLVGRLGDRWAMAVGTVLLVVVAAGASFSRSPLELGVMVFLMGCGNSVWMLARLAYVSERAPVEMRGRALSLLGGTNRVGNFVGPLVGGFMGVMIGLASVFWLLAVLATVASVMMFILTDSEGEADIHHGSIYQRFAGVLADHRGIFVTAGTATLCLQVLRTSRYAVIPLWGEAIGLSPAQIGIVFGFASFFDMLLFYPVGMVMDRFGRKWAGVPSMLLLAVSLALIPLTDSFATLMAVGLVTGIGNGLGAGVVMTLGADFSPPGSRGEFLGVWRLIGDIGTAGGPMVVGGLASLLSLGAASVATGGFGLIGAGILAFLVAEPLQRRDHSRRS